MRNFFSRSDISSNFSVLVPKRICRTSAIKAKTANYILRPYFSFTGSACRCAQNVHCSQCQTTLTFTATRLLIWRRKVLKVLLFLFKMHTLRITARFVTCSFPSSRIPGRPRTSACFCAKARLIRATSLLGFGSLKTLILTGLRNHCFKQQKENQLVITKKNNGPNQKLTEIVVYRGIKDQ